MIIIEYQLNELQILVNIHDGENCDENKIKILKEKLNELSNNESFGKSFIERMGIDSEYEDFRAIIELMNQRNNEKLISGIYHHLCKLHIEESVVELDSPQEISIDLSSLFQSIVLLVLGHTGVCVSHNGNHHVNEGQLRQESAEDEQDPQ